MSFELNYNQTEKPKDAEAEKRELFKQTTVYINAGGRGTQMESVFTKGPTGVTKALIEFNDKPMVQNHVDLLLELGFGNVIIGAGDHLNVKEYFKDREDERLSVVNTEVQEDTGGDLIKAIRESRNVGKNVLVENVDTILYIRDISEFLSQHEKTGATATIILTTRKGVPNKGAFFVDKNGKVVFSREASAKHELIEPTEWKEFRGSSTGTVIFKTEALRSYDWQSGTEPLSVYRDILPELIKKGELYAYNNEDNIFIDTGTPDKYHQIKRHEKRLFGALRNKYMRQVKK